MKEAIITDLDGYMEDVTLVADNVTGVFPILEPISDMERNVLIEKELTEPIVPTESELITVGYTVAVPAPTGLYKLRYDLETYHAAIDKYNRDFAVWQQEMKHRMEGLQKEEGGTEKLVPPAFPQLSQFWIEGYKAEELQEIKKSNTHPSPTDFIGEQMVQLKLSNIANKNMIHSMAEEIAELKQVISSHAD